MNSQRCLQALTLILGSSAMRRSHPRLIAPCLYGFGCQAGSVSLRRADTRRRAEGSVLLLSWCR